MKALLTSAAIVWLVAAAPAFAADGDVKANEPEPSECEKRNPDLSVCGPACGPKPACSCEAFEDEWHHRYYGVMAQVAGAMRGYNHQTVQAFAQFGFKDMAFEIAAGGSNVRIQELPDVLDPYQLSGSIDGRTIFYGNQRHRTGFFLGAGATWVPRDEVSTETASFRDTRTEWWVRAPLGIDVQLPVSPIEQQFNVVLVGRGFMEAWIPVGRLDSEVTVMFGIALGVMFGDHNDRVGFTK